MRILLLDIETSPNEVYVWELFRNDYIPIEHVKTSRRILCWSAKWYDDDKMLSASVLENGEVSMLNQIRGLLNDADVVVHYNGTKFDIPILNTEFIRAGMSPPSPYKQVDLRMIMRNKFRFSSAKLQFISKELELGSKLEHEGIGLWVKCMEGNRDAVKRMVAYNKQDVVLLEKLYTRMLPWVDLHPNHGAYNGTDVCPACGSKHYQSRGTYVASSASYIRFQCQDCGKWFRGSKPMTKKREVGTRNVCP